MSEDARARAGRALPLEPVSRRSLADDIADRLRGRIFDGTYAPGFKLPPERELARQLNVNRGSIREALKKLQHLGLIRIRQGDGTRVQNFFHTANLDLVRYLLQESRLDREKLLSDLMEVRTHTCVLIVELATRRAPRESLEQLRDKLAGELGRGGPADPERAIHMDFEFYEELARLSGNLILSLMLNTVKPPFRLLKPMFSRLVPAAETMVRTQAAIVERMLAGDAGSARMLAGEYLQAGAELLLESLRGSDAEGDLLASDAD